MEPSPYSQAYYQGLEGNQLKLLFFKGSLADGISIKDKTFTLTRRQLEKFTAAQLRINAPLDASPSDKPGRLKRLRHGLAMPFTLAVEFRDIGRKVQDNADMTDKTAIVMKGPVTWSTGTSLGVGERVSVEFAKKALTPELYTWMANQGWRHTSKTGTIKPAGALMNIGHAQEIRPLYFKIGARADELKIF